MIKKVYNPEKNTMRLRKLNSLTSPGGLHIIGTVTEPCIFSNAEIEREGFSVCFRTTGYYENNTRQSELVVFKKE